MSELRLLRWLAPPSAFDVHLQWFAAEDEGRTEEPTEHKLRKAREEGKVAKSGELPSALVLLFAAAVIGLLGGYFLKNVLHMLRYFLLNSCTLDVASDGGPANAFLSYFLKLVAPVMAVALVAAILGNVLQVGFSSR